MARDVRSLEDLQRRVLAAAQVGPSPALAQALDDVRNGTDLPAGLAAYRAALAAAVAPRPLDALLTDVATGSLTFLGPLAAAARPLVEQARARAVDLNRGVDVGPAALSLTAPVVRVPADPGNPGEIARALAAHLPVDGLSARLALGPVNASGAGFLDPARRAAGAMLRTDLGPARVDLALLVDDRQGLGVLALLRAEFRPTGLQVGLGFSLDAVGGVVGVHRTVDADALRRRIGDGSALDALFGGGTSTDQIRRTLDALRDVFPGQPGSHLAGPTLRLGWLTVAGGSLVRLDVGVMVLVPSGRVLLPGRIVVEVPGAGVPLLHLRLDVLGEVDLAGRRLALDAALVDSHVLATLRVSGTAAVRMSWGDPAVVLATIGGFYPGFRPEPAVVPPQRRIGIDLSNPVPSGLSLSLEGYVATAAGTLQAGASATVALEVVGTGIRGTAGFDAIVQLSPLWFEARVFGRVSLRAFGRSLLGVDLNGRLTGPGPMVLTVTATGEILCFDVGGTTSFTLSGGGGADLTPFDGLDEVVRRHLADPAHVSGEGGGDPDVVLAPRPAAGAALVPPGAALVWAQEAFPVGDPLTKIDGRVLRHAAAVQVSPAAGGATTPVTRRLTTAAFTDLRAADALTVPPFDVRDAGWRLTPTRSRSTTAHAVPTKHRTVRLPVQAEDRVWGLTVAAALTLDVPAALRALDRPAALAPDVGPAVSVQPDRWVLVGPAGPDHGQIRSAAGAHAHASATAGTIPLPQAATAEVALP